jgi:hypothetical protein
MIVFQFLAWYFWRVPKKILGAWINFLKFNVEYFSILLLLRTFFAPWKRYAWAYPRAFDLTKYLEITFSNLITRVLGMIMRTILIIGGLVVELFIFLGGLIIFLGWFALPLLLVIMFSAFSF